MDANMRGDKKGQIAIFVIVAIILVAGILIFFLVNRSPKIQRGQDFDNPESYIDNCVKDKLTTVLDTMMLQGGFAEPEDFILYNGDKVTYLCKNINYYEPCVNQHPRYITRLQEEINNEAKSGVEQCFSELENELERRNYEVSGGNVEINAVLKEDFIELKINRDFTMSKEDVTRNFEGFEIVLLNPAFNLAYIANEIADQEAKSCYFSTDGFMALYPKYDIRKDLAYDGQTEIYIIKDKATDKEMKIAIRGCVIPRNLE